jgi:hypothetical protein
MTEEEIDSTFMFRYLLVRPAGYLHSLVFLDRLGCRHVS